MSQSLLFRTLAAAARLKAKAVGVTLGVRGWVQDEGGRLLLVQHSYSDGWHFPGGGVQPGEHAAAAIVREVQEETGVRLTDSPILVGVFHNHRWARGDHVLLFRARHWQHGAWRPAGEIVAAEFFPLSALPSDAAPSVRARVAEDAGHSVSLNWDGDA